ncbi:hypothetical protein HK101_000751 [Irineochytrium annulatum]|nr:hypothetical protein HK101_000751 [Irineochytrium annulatum]
MAALASSVSIEHMLHQQSRCTQQQSYHTNHFHSQPQQHDHQNPPTYHHQSAHQAQYIQQLQQQQQQLQQLNQSSYASSNHQQQPSYSYNATEKRNTTHRQRVPSVHDFRETKGSNIPTPIDSIFASSGISSLSPSSNDSPYLSDAYVIHRDHGVTRKAAVAAGSPGILSDYQRAAAAGLIFSHQGHNPHASLTLQHQPITPLSPGFSNDSQAPVVGIAGGMMAMDDDRAVSQAMIAAAAAAGPNYVNPFDDHHAVPQSGASSRTVAPAGLCWAQTEAPIAWQEPAPTSQRHASDLPVNSYFPATGAQSLYQHPVHTYAAPYGSSTAASSNTTTTSASKPRAIPAPIGSKPGVTVASLATPNPIQYHFLPSMQSHQAGEKEKESYQLALSIVEGPELPPGLPGLSQFVASYVFAQWDAEAAYGPEKADKERVFAAFVEQVLVTTDVGRSIMILAMKFMDAVLRKGSVYPVAEQENRLLIVTLLLSNKVLDDHTFTNRTWSELSNIPIDELNAIEKTYLADLDFRILLTREEFNQWIVDLQAYYKESERKRYAETTQTSPTDPFHAYFAAHEQKVQPPARSQQQHNSAHDITASLSDGYYERYYNGIHASQDPLAGFQKISDMLSQSTVSGHLTFANSHSYPLGNAAPAAQPPPVARRPSTASSVGTNGTPYSPRSNSSAATLVDSYGERQPFLAAKTAATQHSQQHSQSSHHTHPIHHHPYQAQPSHGYQRAAVATQPYSAPPGIYYQQSHPPQLTAPPPPPHQHVPSHGNPYYSHSYAYQPPVNAKPALSPAYVDPHHFHYAYVQQHQHHALARTHARTSSGMTADSHDECSSPVCSPVSHSVVMKRERSDPVAVQREHHHQQYAQGGGFSFFSSSQQQQAAAAAGMVHAGGDHHGHGGGHVQMGKPPVHPSYYVSGGMNIKEWEAENHYV